jgi:CheY-like chemotaxis protein
MQAQENQRFLVVDEDPQFRDLVEETFIDRDDYDVEIAGNPEEGLALLKNKEPCSVIFSDSCFYNSDTNGRQFLETCRKISPLSSRVLCSASLAKSDLIPLVATGEITSYINKPSCKIPISNVAKIGIEHHNIKLLQFSINLIDLQSYEDINNNLTSLDAVDAKVRWKDQGANKQWPDFHEHQAELDRFELHVELVSNAIPMAMARQYIFEERSGQESDQGAFRKKIKDVQMHLNNMDCYLRRSKIVLEKTRDHVANIKAGIAERDEKIKQLKGEL